jgi:protein-tyrosine-phosphatase
MRLLVVCTGNAARSVMAASMLERLAASEGVPLEVATAGTHAVDGQPVGPRTVAALATVAGGPQLGRHRSRQLAADDLREADLVVAMEADHVRYVRRHHPEAAARTATLRRLCRELEPGTSPLAERVAALGLGLAPLGDDDDVDDPAGKDEDAYAACAAELWALCRDLVARL